MCRKELKMKISFLIIIMIALLHLFGCAGDNSSQSDRSIRDDDAYQLNINLSGSLQNPAFSPDGESIIFTRFRNGYNHEPADLCIYNLQTEELTMLVSDGSGNVNLPGSTWNEYISSIIFSSSRDPHDEIYLIAEDGSNGSETQITDRADTVSYEPSISPDGQWIVFESHKLDVEDNGIITKYKIDGSSSYIQLTSSTEDCRQPNWSPAGEKILYQKFDAGQWDIWIMDIDGTNKIKITSGAGDKTDASFTQDGLYIVFSTDFELEYANIYKISISDGTIQRLSYFEGYDGAPSMSSDGTKLLFESYNGDPDDSAGTTIWIIENLL
jgi:TolB protein